MGGDGGDGLVEVLNFDGGEGYLDDVAIRTVFGHLYPISLANHVVDRELNSRHQPQNRILEDEKQNRGQGTQAREKVQGRLVQQDRQNENQARGVDHDFERLANALKRQLARKFTVLVELETGIDYRVNDP